MVVFSLSHGFPATMPHITLLPPPLHTCHLPPYLFTPTTPTPLPPPPPPLLPTYLTLVVDNFCIICEIGVQKEHRRPCLLLCLHTALFASPLSLSLLYTLYTFYILLSLRLLYWADIVSKDMAFFKRQILFSVFCTAAHFSLHPGMFSGHSFLLSIYF